MNILISIGNSDNKLSQAEWSQFIRSIRNILSSYSNTVTVHGEWFSAPDSPWQNANWCIEPLGMTSTTDLAELKTDLITARKRYRQDSIAWTQGPVEFI